MRNFFLPIFIATILCNSCTNDKGKLEELPIGISDAELFNKSFETGFTFYKNKLDTLAFTQNGGGHGGFIRVKFNAIAQSALDTSGELPVNSVFPEKSMIVKEVYDKKGGPLSRIAVLYKSSADPNSNSKWVWTEIFANGNALASVKGKGSACISCHSTTSSNSPVVGDEGNRDFVRTFGIR